MNFIHHNMRWLKPYRNKLLGGITKMIYNRCGNSGLKLPAISLGLWHNFSENDIFSKTFKKINGLSPSKYRDSIK